ncbi:MAG: MBOAT family protein [Lachnospiraceae bacterium]|nr:MBOAT family protein [Lachnospiraceae bacterium]
MVFSSITFLLYFLPLTLLAYFAARRTRTRNIILLLASLFFYAWGEPLYVILMLLSISGNYFMVRFMGEARSGGRSIRGHLVFAVAWNLSILFFFKYANMMIGLVNSLTGLGLGELKLSLPIGISFYTFQALSYVIDVYRGQARPQKSLLSFGLYISMFPQLIAGPIVKYGDIEKSLNKRKVTLGAFGKGAEYFIFGLVKKVLIANHVGAFFTQISAAPAHSRSLLLVWLGALCYTFQIYFDFSGYSDMAIGLGYMLGFRFPVNFRHPYIASSVTEFWRRWHISLSSWFRDYVYIPLGGNRVSPLRHIRNIFIVWGLTGLWHGASLNFVIWGLYYAFWLILEKYLLADYLKRHRGFGHVMTGFVFLIGWVIFAFTDLGQLGQYLGQMIGIGTAGLIGEGGLYQLLSLFLILGIAALASTPIIHRLYRLLREKLPAIAFVLLLLAALISLAYLVYQSYNPFLYFRF